MVKKYYQKYKERLREEAHERYQNLSEEEKDSRWKKTWERYQNFTAVEKEKRQYYLECKKKLPDYRNYNSTQKSNYCIFFKDPRTIRLVSRLNPFKEIMKNFYGFKDFFLLKDFWVLCLICSRLLHFPLLLLYKMKRG